MSNETSERVAVSSITVHLHLALSISYVAFVDVAARCGVDYGKSLARTIVVDGAASVGADSLWSAVGVRLREDDRFSRTLLVVSAIASAAADPAQLFMPIRPHPAMALQVSPLLHPSPSSLSPALPS